MACFRGSKASSDRVDKAREKWYKVSSERCLGIGHINTEQ